MNRPKTTIADFPVTTTIKVEWRHMDAAGHVHNMQHLGYFETCRIAFFEALNFEVVPQNGVGIVVAKVDCTYIYPITYPDTLTGAVRVTEYGNDFITLNMYLFSEKYDKAVAISNQKLVFYHYGKKEKAARPDDFLERLKGL